MAQSGLRDGGGSTSSPDGATAIVGEQGIEALQEDGQLVVKTGVSGEQRDFDILERSITDTTEVVADPQQVGTTTELSGGIKSDEDQPFTIEIEWQDDDGVELFTQTYQSDTEFTITSITTKSDNVEVRVKDESSQGTENQVSGTINFH